MNLVYVAGPVRNPSLYERHKNILRGESVAVELWQMGFAVISPHKNCEFIDGAVTDEQIIAGDLEIISRCDAVIILPGWKSSVGTRAERTFCLENNIPIFYWDLPDDRVILRLWARGTYDLKQHLERQRQCSKKESV